MYQSKCVKRWLSSLCTAAFVCSMLSANASILTSAADRTIQNLVICAQFDKAPGSNFMAEYTDDLISMCNDDTTFRSLSGYINEVSYGKLNTQCVFPQLEGDVIIPYTMEMSVNDYYDMEEAAIEVMSNASVPDDMNIDGDNDGIIDNIILIFESDEESAAGIFWPCATTLPGIDINGCSSGTINIQNSISLFESLISGGAGVLCHEFMHSIGYPDLYRNDSRSGAPVAGWDIMASNSIYMQYPLAYMRSSVSGWLESTDITDGGRYTLQPASARSGNRLYLLKTDLSDTEFFAVEFRQQGAQYTEEMDIKIYGTGMVVYRVNTEVLGNYKTDNDQIYVFRPDEMVLDAGEGNLYASCYGGTGAPNTVGSLDFSATVADGALVYSDGTNSGILLSDITVNDDTLDFTVQFADTSAADFWKSTGGTGEMSSGSSLELDSGENPYLLTCDSNYINLYELLDGTWSNIGKPLGTGAYGNVNQAKLTICNGIPYVLYHDSNYNCVLARYSNGEWTTIYTGSELAQYSDLTASADKLYIAYTTGSYPYALQVAEIDALSNEVTLIGSDIASNACSLSIASSGDSLGVSYRDLDDGGKPKLALFDDGAWSISALAEQSCGGTSITAIDGGFCVAVSETAAGLYTYKDGVITNTGLPAELTGDCYTIVATANGNDVYTAINVQSDDAFEVCSLEGNELVQIGNTLELSLINNPTMTLCNGTLYVGYVTENDTVVIRSYELSATLLGDINLDGNVDIRDVAMLAKRAAGVITLSGEAEANADVTGDGLVDIRDVAKLAKVAAGVIVL